MKATDVKQYLIGVLRGWFNNKNVLDKFSESNTGTLLYDNQPIESNNENNVYNNIGIILPFMGGPLPNNYLLCDGTIYNIDDYPELAEFIYKELENRSHYGGDGILTFAVPNLSMFPMQFIIKATNNDLSMHERFFTATDKQILDGNNHIIVVKKPDV